MIQTPLDKKQVFSSKENIVEFCARIAKKYRREGNTLNKNKVNSEEYESYYKFTFVRNPWARAYSWYRNVMRDKKHQKYYGISPDISFDEFLVRNIGKGMLRPQIYWLKDFSGEINFDFIGRFEDLNQDFKVVKTALNIEDGMLSHEINGGENINYRDFYDKKSIDLITKYYKEEIEMFGYEF